MRIKKLFAMICLFTYIFLNSIPVFAGESQNKFTGISGASVEDIIIVGPEGFLSTFNGIDYVLTQYLNTGISENLNSVWVSDTGMGFAVGDSGIIVSFNGSKWTKTDSPSNNNLNGIWGTDLNNIFIVGDFGEILHFDGDTWSQMSTNTAANLISIHGSSENEIFAVSEEGTVLFYNGTDWSILPEIPSSSLDLLTDGWTFSSSAFFVTGLNNLILKYNGESWEDLSQSGTPNIVTTIWGFDLNHIITTLDLGRCYSFTNTSLETIQYDKEPLPTNSAIFDSWGNETSIFFVGSKGTILKYDSDIDFWMEIPYILEYVDNTSISPPPTPIITRTKIIPVINLLLLNN